MYQLNRVTLHTPESVKLQFTLAGIGNRIQALFFDYLVIGALLTVALGSFGALLISSIDLATLLNLDEEDLQLWIVAIQILVTSFLYTAYFIGFEVFWQGQSPGKRYTQIRVIREDGRAVGLKQAVLRTLIRPIDDLFFVGLFMILFTEREKRLGDWAAGTLVIQVESPAQGAEFSTSSAAQGLAPQLAQQCDLSQLTPDDFAVIREFLRRRPLLVPQAKAQLAADLCRQTAEKIQLAALPIGINPEIALEAVYLAYQEQRAWPSGGSQVKL